MELTSKQLKELVDKGQLVPSKRGYRGVIPLPTETNKKVRNAKKTLHCGILFDSLLEVAIFDYLNFHEIKFERQKKYVLLEKFERHGKKYREMTWSADFYLPDYDIIIEGKGFETDRYKIVKKLFAYKYETKVIIIKNKKEISIKLNEIEAKIEILNDK